MRKNYTTKPALCDKKRHLKNSFNRIHAVILLAFLLSAFTGWGQPLLVENFSYANGTLLTANGWTNHSGTSNFITVTSPSTISYPGYLSTDIGGEVTLLATGEDVNRTFTSQTSGTIYFSFLVNVTSTSTTGDYFFHISTNPLNNSYFRGRIFVKKDASNNVFFGIAQSTTATVNYSATPYALNTTYLIVLKFDFVTGDANDVSSILINPPLNAPIPVSGWISNTDAAGLDATNVGLVALRQGTAGNAVGAKLDGIRISTTWSDIVGVESSSPTLIADPQILDGFTYIFGSGPSTSKSYSLSGSNLTGYSGDITITGTANYEVSSDDVIFDASATIPYTSATLEATPVYVRLKSGLAVNTYNSESVSNTGGGVTSAVNVTCNGLVYSGEPTNHATNFQAGTVTTLTIPLTWIDATGGIVPTGYLIKGNATGYGDIIPPVDYIAEADGALVKNVAAGVGTITFTNLQPNTTLYFKIWPYVNSGAYIDYKLNGTVPQHSSSTVALNFRSIASGAWNSALTWEISNDNSTWNPATTEIPIYRTSDVTIKSGYLVNVPLSYNSGTAKNLTVENGATLSSSGICYVYVYGDILNDGTIGGASDFIGFDIEGPSCTLSGSGSIIASTIAKYTTANATTNFTINQNLTLTYTHASNAALYNSQSLTTTFNITVAAGKQLTVSNARINLNGCTLTLNSDVSGTASLIAKEIIGTGASSVIMQRYIGAWTSAINGWHLLSSPVGSQLIDPEFTDPIPANYDFYKWDEPTNIWLNYKSGGFTNFVAGTGYLVAYANTDTKQFTGTLNTANVPVTGLTNSSGVNHGWHLLGNPFSCALTWGTANWAMTNITATAKIWEESSASYIDIDPGEPIPAMNGFMVETSDAGALTIPILDRVHSATAWYKDGEAFIKLVARDLENSTAQETNIKVNANATEGFDREYDSHFLAGYAPMFYSIIGDEYLSTNSLPNLDNGRVIEMGFVKNTATEFSIGLNAEIMIPGLVVYLTDKKTGAVTELKQDNEYAFTSLEGDDASRFLLHFGPLGIDDPSANENYSVYSSAGNIYIASQQAGNADVRVSNLLGQVVMRSQTNGNNLTTLDANTLQNGIYLVSVIEGSKVTTQKVLISK